MPNNQCTEYSNLAHWLITFYISFVSNWSNDIMSCCCIWNCCFCNWEASRRSSAWCWRFSPSTRVPAADPTDTHLYPHLVWHEWVNQILARSLKGFESELSSASWPACSEISLIDKNLKKLHWETFIFRLERMDAWANKYYRETNLLVLSFAVVASLELFNSLWFCSQTFFFSVT